MKPLRRATVRTKGSGIHPLLLAFAGGMLGLAIWGYWRLAREALSGGEPAKLAAHAEPTAELVRARAFVRKNYLDPLAHVRLAERLYRDGRLSDSFLVLDAALSFFGEARFAFAHTSIILENDPEAGGVPAAAAAALQGPPTPAPQAVDFERDARMLAARAEFEAALQTVDAGLAAAPRQADLIALKALLLSRFLSRPAEAVPLYRGLALGDPATPAGRLAVEFLGRRAHLASVPRGADGRRPVDVSGAQAAETLEELARQKPADPRIFQTLAMLRWTRGDVDSVRKMTQAALARDPKHAGALSMAGALALADKDADGAIRNLEAALLEEPGDLYAALKLAELRQHYKADLRAALPLWIAVHRLDPWRDSQGRPVAEIIREGLATQSAAALEGADAARVEKALEADDAATRAQACVAAGKSGDARFIEPLGRLLDDDAELSRKSADEALFALGRGAHRDAIHRAAFGWLDSDKTLVRGRALNLAADLFPDKTKPRAILLLRDPDPTLRVIARLAIEHYWPADKGAREAIRLAQAEERSELALALLRSRSLDGSKAAPSPAPSAAPKKAPPPAPRRPPKRAKPATPRELAAEQRKLGEARLKAGRVAEAASAFEKADALNGGDPDTLLDLARAYSLQGAGSKAASALRRCLAAARDSGRKTLARYKRLAQTDAQLVHLRGGPGFAILLKSVE